MDSTGAVGACLEHPERSGTPCSRCGTFRCGACLRDGLCPLCTGNIAARAPQPEETVGFGPRAGARIIDLVVSQLGGLVAGVLAAIVLAILEATGVARTGWLTRLDHGFAFNFLSGSTASIIGATLCTGLCGASPGKWALGLRVIRTSGERAGFGASMVRELAYFIDALFFGLVAKGQMDGSAMKQRLGDQWALTVVVRAATLPVGVMQSMGLVALGVFLGIVAQSIVLAGFFVGAAL